MTLMHEAKVESRKSKNCSLVISVQVVTLVQYLQQFPIHHGENRSLRRKLGSWRLLSQEINRRSCRLKENQMKLQKEQ